MAERDLSAELTAYIDGALDAATARAVEEALARDPALRAMEARLRRTVEKLQALPTPAPVRSAAERRRALLEALDAPPWHRRLADWLRGPAGIPVGLAAAAAAAVGLVLWPRRREGAEDGEEAPAGEQLLLAQNLELVEDFDVLGLDAPDDVDVVAALHELEALQ